MIKFGIVLIFLSVFSCLALETKNKNENSTTTPSQHFRAFLKCQETVSDIPDTPDAVQSPDRDVKVYCKADFDGIGCWSATLVNTTATIPCPDYISGSKIERNSTRKCLANASWEWNSDTGRDEGNYAECDFTSKVQLLSADQLLDLFSVLEHLDHSPYADLNTEQAFEKCIDEVLVQPKSEAQESYCGRTFDGWGCWNDTPASHQAHIPCPNFIPGFSHDKIAYKVCTENGTWYRHYQSNKTWSNYTTCVDLDDYAFRQKIVNIHIVGYSLSVVALFVSLVIFISFKSLSSQTRITIHKNLFVSFIINNTMWIIWYIIVNKYETLERNGFDCQSLHIVVHYFMVCNYFWMFCEGLYLHTLLVIAFVSERKILKWFYIIGWILPVPLTAIYAFLRHSSHDPNDTQFCWIYDSTYSLLLSGPVCLSLVLNLFFLINIVRVLYAKLRAVNSPDTHQTRKAVRATLILIPLLGLHYILMLFRPAPKSYGESAYEVFSAIATSFQGLCVAMLFCFFNGEVINQIKKKWNQFRLSHDYTSDLRSRSFATTAVSYVHSKYEDSTVSENTKSTLLEKSTNCVHD